MNIGIIGTGKVATILSEKLFFASHEISFVAGRNKTATQHLAEKYNALALNLLDEIPNQVDVVLIAVSDTVIETILNRKFNNNIIIAHTSGAISKDILNKCSNNFGVFYPLQSITKATKPNVEIPFLIDGNNDFTSSTLFDIAKSISPKVSISSDSERTKIHVAAVVVNNFTNYLFAVAEDYCAKENIDFSLLLPIIQETAERIKYVSAKDVFTGPAIRKDENTITKHLNILEHHPSLKTLYLFLNKSLQDYYQNLSS